MKAAFATAAELETTRQDGQKMAVTVKRIAKGRNGYEVPNGTAVVVKFRERVPGEWDHERHEPKPAQMMACCHYRVGMSCYTIWLYDSEIAVIS